MEITVSHVEGRVAVTVFQINGELTVESYEELQRLAEEDYVAGTRNVLLDLEGVSVFSPNFISKNNASGSGYPIKLPAYAQENL